MSQKFPPKVIARGRSLSTTLRRRAAPFFALVVATLLVASTLPRPTQAAPGDLDYSFGGDGKVIVNFSSASDFRALDVAVQADGKIVVVGYVLVGGSNYDFAVARYNADGSLDDGGPNDSTPGNSFGAGGVVQTDFSGAEDVAHAVAIQTDGKIVAAGYTSSNVNDFALARYNADGSPDNTFDGDGKVTVDFNLPSGSGDQAFSVVIQTDGKIVAGGRAGFGDYALARFNSNGSLDGSFDGDGKFTNDFDGFPATVGFAYSIALQSDGKIVAGGRNQYYISQSPVVVGEDFGLLRVNTNGTLDATFGSGGKVQTDIGGSTDWLQDIAIQTDGRIVAAGYAENQPHTPANTDSALARYNTNGSLDDGGANDSTPGDSFGAGGKVINALEPNTTDTALSLELQSDGKILSAGQCASSTCVVRYNTDGSPDTGYGSGGKVVIGGPEFNPPSDQVAGDLQPDGKLLVLSGAGGLARLLDDPSECTTPPAGMVGWWPGDGNALDYVNNNHGTLQGGATYAPGMVAQAFSLDGIDDAVSLGNGPELRVSANDFTIDAWVKFNALSHPPGANTAGAPAGDMSILDKMAAGGINTDGWRLLKQDDNRFWFCLGGGSGNLCGQSSHTLFSQTVAAVGVWYHLTVVKTSTTFSIYVNGALEDTRALPSFTDTNSTDLLIGSYVLQDAHLNGLVDEVEVFTRALTPAEIQSIYHASSFGKCKPPTADLSIEKAESRDPALVDRVLTYTLTVTNHGPDAASNVQVSDVLPSPGVNFQSAVPSQGTCGLVTSIVHCQLGTMASGATASVQIKVKPTQPGTLTNTAHVSSDAVDTDPSDNSATITTQAVVAADVSVTKNDSRDPALVNQIFSYNLRVENAGPAAATNVVITDALPSGLTFNSATASQGSCSHSAGMVTCQLGTLAVNAEATAQIKVKPTQSGTVSNTASVTASEHDPDTTNNSSTEATTILRSADLSIRKRDAQDPVLLDGQVTYTLTVTNGGPVGATGVIVNDTLPTSMTFVSASASQGGITSSPPVGSTGTVTAGLGNLAVGATATVNITVKATLAGVFTNTASVSGSESDEDTSNNTHKQQTTVVTLLKLTLSNSMVVGGCEHPTGTVFLTGPAPAGGVTVSLSSTNPAATTPPTVNIPAGQTKSGPFTVTTQSVTSQQTGSIRATLGAKTVGRALTVMKGGCE